MSDASTPQTASQWLTQTPGGVFLVGLAANLAVLALQKAWGTFTRSRAEAKGYSEAMTRYLRDGPTRAFVAYCTGELGALTWYAMMSVGALVGFYGTTQVHDDTGNLIFSLMMWWSMLQALRRGLGLRRMHEDIITKPVRALMEKPAETEKPPQP